MRGQDLGWVSDGDPAEWDRGACWQRRTQVYDAVDAHLGAPAPPGGPRVARGPTRTLSPMVSGLPRTPRRTAVSMTTQLVPMWTAPLSALTTAPKPIEMLAPINTSPQIVAFGAMRADRSITGRFPLCSENHGLPLDGSDV